MATNGTLAPPSPAPLDLYPEFDLAVQITTDVAVGYSVRRCDSSDTCGSTCGSACASS